MGGATIGICPIRREENIIESEDFTNTLLEVYKNVPRSSNYASFTYKGAPGIYQQSSLRIVVETKYVISSKKKT